MNRLLGRMAPIALEELNEKAALQTRVDRKYLVTGTVLENILRYLSPSARVLTINGRREFRYFSVYYDTRDRDSYFDAAHGRDRRWKIREREYVDQSSRWLEVKTRRGGRTIKQRRAVEESPRREWNQDERDAVNRALAMCGIAPVALERLMPTLTTSYWRATLYEPCGDMRITIDRGLEWRRASDGTAAGPMGLYVVETKSAGPAPGTVDHLLWALGARPRRFSKYATGLAILEPDLAHNRWHATLRHIAPGVVRAAAGDRGGVPGPSDCAIAGLPSTTSRMDESGPGIHADEIGPGHTPSSTVGGNDLTVRSGQS